MAYICCYKIVKIMTQKFERYQLLAKEVQYIIPFVSNWEVFDFENLQRSLDEMKELQKHLKQKELLARSK